MNLKILKFAVIFMGILIVAGVVMLSVGVFYKINNMKANKSSMITNHIDKLDDHEIKDFYVEADKLIVEYKKKDKYVIVIYDIFTGNKVNRIELLK